MRGSSTSTWTIAGTCSRRARGVRTNTLMSPSSGKQNVIRQRPQQRPQPGPTTPRTGCQWTRRETPRIGCRSRRWPEPGKRGFPSGATTVGRRDTQSDSAQILMCQVRGQDKKDPGEGPGAASKAGGNPLPRGERGTRRRTGRGKCSRWPQPPPPPETGQPRESQPAPGPRSPAASTTSGTTSSSIWM